MNPQRILMIRSHSMGVGDVLRSSAAWASLHKRWPQAQLHLLFLSRHAGYPTEALIANHHALASAEFLTIKTARPGDPLARWVPWSELKVALQHVAHRVDPDLIIDFEPHGLRTTRVTRALKRMSGAKTVGIGQFPLRGWLYDFAAPSSRHYQILHGLSNPMDYTERDYVALAALGINRQSQAIELKLTPQGEVIRSQTLQDKPTAALLLGLNIGCGTPDAAPKRPPIDALAKGLLKLAQMKPFHLLLTGAPFEQPINNALVQRIHSLSPDGICPFPILDRSGTRDLLELAGVVAACDAFVSSDSGPYHMAVALGLPTLLWLEVWEPSSLHRGHQLRHLMHPSAEDFAQTAQDWLESLNPPIR